MAIGAYTLGVLHGHVRRAGCARLLGVPAGLRRDSVVLLLAALAIGALLAAIAGFLVGVPSLRLRGDYLAIVTLGFGEIIRVLILNIDAVGGARGLRRDPEARQLLLDLPLRRADDRASSTGSSTRRSAARCSRSARTRSPPRRWASTRRAPRSSRSWSRPRWRAWREGSSRHYLMYIHTNSFTFLKSFEIIIMIVIGGLGSITGSVLGAVLFIALTEGAARSSRSTGWSLFSLLLILIMIVRPQGLLGHREFVTFLTRRAPPLERPLRDDRSRLSRWRSSSSRSVTMRFGGLIAVNELELAIEAGAALRPDRPERRGQDDGLQRHHRRLQADRGRGPVSRAGDRRRCAAGKITRRGVARTFQNIRLFGEMSVLDNVKVAFDCRQATTLAHRDPSHAGAPRGGGAGRSREPRAARRSSSSTTSPTRRAKNLPYGSQRRLEIARAMATAPRLLLPRRAGGRDEPARVAAS